jgi:hypothetical protein
VTATIGVDILIGLAVLGLILYRQLQVRPVRDNMRLPAILAVIGVIELAQYLQHRPHGPEVFAALAGSLRRSSSAPMVPPPSPRVPPGLADSAAYTEGGQSGLIHAGTKFRGANCDSCRRSGLPAARGRTLRS